MYSPSFQTFEKLSREGNLIPVYREILADTETPPVSVLMKLRSKSHAFLLESVEGGEKWGRYTFLGADPRVIFRVKGTEVLTEENRGANNMVNIVSGYARDIKGSFQTDGWPRKKQIGCHFESRFIGMRNLSNATRQIGTKHKISPCGRNDKFFTIE